MSLPGPPPCADWHVPLLPSWKWSRALPWSIVLHLIRVARRKSLTRCRQLVPPFGDAQLHPLAGSGSELGPQPMGRGSFSCLTLPPCTDLPLRPQPVPSSSEHPSRATPRPCPPDLGAPFCVCRKRKSTQYFSQGHIVPTSHSNVQRKMFMG